MIKSKAHDHTNLQEETGGKKKRNGNDYLNFWLWSS